MFDDKIMSEATCLAEEHKKYLHTVPESAFEETETTAYIKGICGRYPVEKIDIGMDTGAVYYLDTGRDETIALRADIDALLTEQGPQHLCGHDAHSSTLLGAMHYLCAVKEELPYNVLFIFQPAEEGTRGAKAMLDHGLLEKVPQKPIRIFGIHNGPEVDCGDVVVHKGPLMSEKSVYRITYTGVPGHGSLPHKCVDPIVAAASFVTGLQTVVSRNIDPFEPVICTVNSLTAGAPDIPVPKEAVITGYFRSFNHETHVRMEERLRQLAESTAEAYECGCDISIVHAVPAVDNTEEMYLIALRAAEAAVGREHIVDSRACLASEDFAVFGEKIPSFFYWVGSGTPGKSSASWHDPAFCIDPHYVETAVPVLCASALIK
jgi:amidohydrolase